MKEIIIDKIRKADHACVPPLIDNNCDTLVLGSMLSPKSARDEFYYAHPQNRFWRVLAAVFGVDPAKDICAKKKLALTNRIALWDVIKSCDIVGAADSTIKNVRFNDISGLLAEYPKITRIFTTGSKAYELLMKYNESVNSEPIAKTVRLPSTSPQNFRIKFDDLVQAYKILKNE